MTNRYIIIHQSVLGDPFSTVHTHTHTQSDMYVRFKNLGTVESMTLCINYETDKGDLLDALTKGRDSRLALDVDVQV
jgi:hypothetical protein